jgi:hypothetical protein
VRSTGGEAAWSWFISLIAFGLVFWAIVEFLNPRAGSSLRIVPATETAVAWPDLVEATVELHRLLPDATDDLGRPVQVDGTVVGESSAAGFWVRDLRDNVVYIAREGAAPSRSAPLSLHPGDPVRVRGVIAILTPREQAERLERAGLVVPSNAVVIRDVKILSNEDGIEVLRD